MAQAENNTKGFQEYSKADQNRAALTAFFNLTKAWGLTVEQQSILLGDIPKSTLMRWKKNPENAGLNMDSFDRISYMLGIHKSLRILFSGESVYNVLKRPIKSPIFKGKTPMETMLSGHMDNMRLVRDYFDGWRG